MKRIFTIALTYLASVCLAQESEQEVLSRISNVTVFLDGAQVTRTADVTVKQGISILSLKGISRQFFCQIFSN